MNFKKTEDGAGLTIELTGDLDSMNVPDLENRLKQEADGVTQMVFDLSELDYVSSAGLRVFLSMQKRMKKQNGKVVFRYPTEDVMEILKVTGFTKLLTIEME